MGLACMLFLGVPFQASAAEVTGTLSTEISGEDGAADGADNSSDAAANPDSGADSSTPDAGAAADNPAAANDKADDNVVIKESDKPYLALGADLSEDQKQVLVLRCDCKEGERKWNQHFHKEYFLLYRWYV